MLIAYAYLDIYISFELSKFNKAGLVTLQLSIESVTQIITPNLQVAFIILYRK